MMRIFSIGLIEITILALGAGLTLLAGGLVLAIVAITQRGRSTRANPQPGPGATTSRSSNPGKWLLLLGFALAILLVVPLIVAVGSILGGILIVTPVRSVRTAPQEPAAMAQVVAMPAPIGTSLGATPIHTPRPTSESGAGLAEVPPPGPASLSISPDDNMLFLTLPGIAGLAVLLGALILAVVLTRWRGSDAWPNRTSETSRERGSKQSRDQGTGDDSGENWARTARLRYALLALAIWFALSIFLILDVGFSVSVYWQFVAAYVAFWVLVGGLLLVGSPRREKLLLLGLLVVILFSIRFVDWNSRKPFLKDLYRVKVGMSVEQVEQIMGSYMGGTCQPADPLGLPAGNSAAETAALALADRAVYRHTDEGWGDSDWGEIRFEAGHVVEIQFLPD